MYKIFLGAKGHFVFLAQFAGLPGRPWYKPQLRGAGLKPGHVEARDWAGTSHQLTDFPQTTLPLPLCWQKFCYLRPQGDYLGHACAQEHGSWALALWLQTLQSSWEQAEATGAPSMRNLRVQGLQLVLPEGPGPSHPTQLPPPRARCPVTFILVLTRGEGVFENKVVFFFFFLIGPSSLGGCPAVRKKD